MFTSYLHLPYFILYRLPFIWHELYVKLRHIKAEQICRIYKVRFDSVNPVIKYGKFSTILNTDAHCWVMGVPEYLRAGPGN